MAWSVEWFKILDSDILVANLDLREQSVVPLFPELGACEFFSPTAMRFLIVKALHVAR